MTTACTHRDYWLNQQPEEDHAAHLYLEDMPVTVWHDVTWYAMTPIVTITRVQIDGYELDPGVFTQAVQASWMKQIAKELEA